MSDKGDWYITRTENVQLNEFYEKIFAKSG